MSWPIATMADAGGRARAPDVLHELVPDEVGLAGTDDDLAVAVLALRALEQRPRHGGAASVRDVAGSRQRRVEPPGPDRHATCEAGAEHRPA